MFELTCGGPPVRTTVMKSFQLDKPVVLTCVLTENEEGDVDNGRISVQEEKRLWKGKC